MSGSRRDLFFERLVVSACVRPDEVVISDGCGRVLTRAGLLARIDETASLLHAHDWERVALRADNGLDWIVADLALLALGITCVPLPTFFSDEQCAHVMHVTDADGLLAPGELAGFVGVASAPVGGHRVGALELWPTASPHVPRGTPWAKVTFTSGTTGTPKDVALTDEALLAKADALVVATRARADDVHFCALPLSVLLENVGGVYRALASGGTIVAPPAPARGVDGSSSVDGARLAIALEDAMATVVILVPAMLEALVTALEASSRRLPHLRVAGVGGAPAAPALLDRAWAVGVPAYQGYGLSEAASVVAFEQPGDGRRRGTVGRPLVHGVRTASDGELLVDDVVGVGRLGDSEPPDGPATLATGDLGSVDADGFVTVYGRKDDLIVTAHGRNVSPAWVETQLVGGPIAQVAVFGHGRDALDALVVARQGADDVEIARHVDDVNASLPDYARVAAWARAPDAFSLADGTLTRSGTPDRRRLAERHAALLAASRAQPAIPTEITS